MKITKGEPKWVGATGYCYVCDISLTLEPDDRPFLKADVYDTYVNVNRSVMVWYAHCPNCENVVKFIHEEDRIK